MKLFVISTIATVIGIVTASGHMNLAKRAYVTNVAIETITVTEDSYLFEYNGIQAVNMMNNLELAISGLLGARATHPSFFGCNEFACPLTSLIGEFLISEFQKYPPTIQTTAPKNTRVLSSNNSMKKSEGKKVDIDVSHMATDALMNLSPAPPMNFGQSNEENQQISDEPKETSHETNKNASEFVSAAEKIMAEAQGAVNKLLKEYLS